MVRYATKEVKRHSAFYSWARRFKKIDVSYKVCNKYSGLFNKQEAETI